MITRQYPDILNKYLLSGEYGHEEQETDLVCLLFLCCFQNLQCCYTNLPYCYSKRFETMLQCTRKEQKPVPEQPVNETERGNYQ